MTHNRTLAFALVVIMVATLATAWPSDVRVDQVLRGENGNVHFLVGHLGFVVDGDAQAYVDAVHPLLDLSGRERFEFRRREQDFRGNQHVHFQQFIGAIEVDGGELAVHYNPTSGVVFALSVSVLADVSGASYMRTLRSASRVKDLAALIARASPAAEYSLVDKPTVVLLVHEDTGYACVRANIRYRHAIDGVEMQSAVYASPMTGERIAEFPLFFPALNRTIYNAEHNETLPGTLMRKEGGKPTGDVNADAAYDNAGVCYNFYKTKFNRDSYDGKGALMVSTVHYGVDYNNAFWNGSQMAYGDGDGKIFANFSSDLSVVCHELTHAVVQYTAGLRYWKESGALNEGFADIMGASADIFNHTDCIFEQQWQIGYETFLAGEALRFMNNPTLDGSSYDYYPERYTGFRDNGGVHSNSGIANLAYVLAVQGGVHPRQKTTFWVTPIGLNKAEQVFYAALSQYMLRTSNFAATRLATEIAATQLYGANEARSISLAWAAVGVGEMPPPPPSPSPPSPAPEPEAFFSRS